MTTDFDFGFTMASEDELEAVKLAKAAKSHAEDLVNKVQLTAEEKVTKLMASFSNLLDNLSRDPEKDYIMWPNRIEQLQKYRSVLSDIVGS